MLANSSRIYRQGISPQGSLGSFPRVCHSCYSGRGWRARDWLPDHLCGDSTVRYPFERKQGAIGHDLGNRSSSDALAFCRDRLGSANRFPREYAAESLGGKANTGYKFWHGWTPVLFMSFGAIALALGIVRILPKIAIPTSDKLSFDAIFDALVGALRSTASSVAGLLQNGKLVTHLAFMLAFIGASSFLALDVQHWDDLDVNWSGDSFIFIGLTPLLIIATIIAARSESTVALLVSLGFVGFIIALLFLWFSAPDLALTQLMAETLILFLLAGALAKVKRAEVSEPKLFRFIIAVLAGVLVTALILKSMALEWDHPVSGFHLR